MNDAQIAVMSELCVKLGFCLTAGKDWNWFAAQNVRTPDDFVRAVYEAEGLDHGLDTRRSLKATVRELGVRYLEAAE